MARAGTLLAMVVLFLVLVPVFPSNATIGVVAVTVNGTGILSSLEVEIIPGRGRTLIVTEPLIGINTQNSERVAKEVAEKIVGASLDDKDVIFTISTDAGSVDGPSAGAAMVVAMVSAMTGKKLNPNVIVTGTIEPEGTVGVVGGVLPKARAAASGGAKFFLIPSGTRNQVERVTTTRSPSPGVFIESEETVRTDVVRYGKDKLGLEVVEVSGINEVLRAFFSDANLTLPEVTIEEIPLPVQGYDASEAPLREIAQKGLARAEAAVRDSPGNASFNSTLANAERLLNLNYFYSSANEAFLLAKGAKETYYNISEARLEVEAKLDSVGRIISMLNGTEDVNVEDMHSLAAGEQRYAWALFYYQNFGWDLDSMLSASEWLSASEDILTAGGRTGGGMTISRASLELKAMTALDDAMEKTASAKASGADTSLAERSLGLAEFALSEGLPLASIYDSVDAEAFAVSESYEGTLAELAGKARDLQINATDPWAISYSKHSSYLLHRASVLNSKEEARSSIFLAIRAIGVETAFSVFPESPGKAKAESGGFRWTDILIIAAFVMSSYSVYRTIRLEGKWGKKRKK
jgi:uncharacterized protein